jgi:phosphomannomutase
MPAIRLIAPRCGWARSVTAAAREMPAMLNTPEMRFQVDESRKFAVVDEVLARLKADREPRSTDRRRRA